MTPMKKPARQRANPTQLSGQAQRYITIGPADPHVLLSCLDKVKETREDSWQACCPAHDDRSPSLNIRLADDGKILLKCWSGCGAADIVAAVGLELFDLFPKRQRMDGGKSIAPSQRWIPRDVLGSLAREALIVLMAAEQLDSGKPLPTVDTDRLAVAAGRLRNAAKQVGCHE